LALGGAWGNYAAALMSPTYATETHARQLIVVRRLGAHHRHHRISGLPEHRQHRAGGSKRATLNPTRQSEKLKMNELVAINENQSDPYIEFGQDLGQVIRFTKVEGWGLGKEKRSVRDRLYLAHVDESSHGMTCWENGKPIDSIFGRIGDRFQVPARESLGHTDETKWPIGLNGEPADPWQYSFRLPMLDVVLNDQATWIGSSWGAQKEFKLLSRRYGADRHKHPGCAPVVKLTSEIVRHPKYGPQEQPRVPIVEWRSLDNRPELKAIASYEPPPPHEGAYGAALNDDVPFAPEWRG
jgi:hypothetical protein